MMFLRAVASSALIMVALAALQAQGPAQAEWRQWGGPNRPLVSGYSRS